MVMVKRSLEAANAIKAGNSKSLIASLSMMMVLNRLPRCRIGCAVLRFG